MSIQQLTNKELVSKVLELREAGITEEPEVAMATGYVLEDGKADVESLVQSLAAAVKEMESSGEYINPLDTIDQDAGNFCSYAGAIVRKIYHEDFGIENVGPLPHQQWQDVAENDLPIHYARLATTVHGMSVINITRGVIVYWFARMGNPAVGSVQERYERYLAVWDEWEVANGGMNGSGGKPSKDVIDEYVGDGVANYNEYLGGRVSEVLSTMAHNNEHPDNQFPLSDAFYDDYKFIHEELTKVSDKVRDAIVTSIRLLPKLSGRFRDTNDKFVQDWINSVWKGEPIQKG